MRQVQKLTHVEQEMLQQKAHYHEKHRVRRRAQAILLSHEGYSYHQIAKLSQVRYNRVSIWITTWEKEKEASLFDKPRSGRPPSLTETEAAQTIAWLNETPRQIKTVCAQVATQFDKVVSKRTIQRIAKKKTTFGNDVGRSSKKPVIP